MEGFLPPTACARVRRAMDEGVRDDAEVLREAEEEGEEDKEGEDIAAVGFVRRAASIEIDAAVLEEVEQRLDTQRQSIADYFGVPLGEREGSGFVRYPDGGFYLPHRDRADVAAWPAAARRTVAVVVFLNSGFEGGVLRLFVDGGPVDIQPQAGLLVAFPADVLHEVTIVGHGPRDAIVDWFYAPAARMQNSEF